MKTVEGGATERYDHYENDPDGPTGEGLKEDKEGNTSVLFRVGQV